MDSGDENVELLNLAIQRLIEERKKKKKKREISGVDFDEDDDEQILLSRLLSQLESLKADRALRQPEDSKEETEIDDKNVGGEHEIDKEEIVKELNKVKKQNTVTHWLLSIMIVVTVAWQISEVSLILKLKEGVSHPFRSLGGFLTGMLRGQGRKGEAEDKPNHIQAPPLPPPLKIPEIPHVELPDLSTNGNRHRCHPLLFGLKSLILESLSLMI